VIDIKSLQIDSGRSGQVGVCNCGQVLIFQLYMREWQWLCLKCGQVYQTPPRSQEGSIESESKWRALESEFMTHCGAKLIVLGMYREGCVHCTEPDEEQHLLHATPSEWQACNDALYWLSLRTGREFRLVNGVISPQ